MPLKNTLRLGAIMTTLAFSATVQSETFLNKEHVLPMDESFWTFQGNVFECNLNLPMKDLGFLDIDHVAGSELQMVFTPFEKHQKPPSIAWSSAPWHQDAKGQYYHMKNESDHFSLSSSKTKNLMNALNQGGWLVFTDRAKYYKVPSLDWSAHSLDFRVCVSELMPLSEDEIRDQVIYFNLGQRTLNLKQLNQIRDIAKTILNTPDVTRILIDSFTDNTGSRLTNLQISRERSADVVSALVSSGVSRSLIEVRSHGERYPSTDNKTKESRDKSRKVTIRVIKEPQESYRK